MADGGSSFSEPILVEAEVGVNRSADAIENHPVVHLASDAGQTNASIVIRQRQDV